MSHVPKGRPIRLPAAAPTELVPLRACEPQSALLDCSAQQDCNHWYRIDVTAPGEMRIQLDFQDVAEGTSAVSRLLVSPLGKPVLAQRMSTFGESLEIATVVAPDVYRVLVQGGGGRRGYELTLALVKPGAPPGLGCSLEAAETAEPGTADAAVEP